MRVLAIAVRVRTDAPARAPAGSADVRGHRDHSRRESAVLQVAGLELPAQPAAAYVGDTSSVVWLPVVDAAATAAPPTTGASSVDPVAARVEAQRRVDEVADDPEGRYRRRAEFYHLGGRRIAHFGGAELAFLRWEIRRGVLRPIAAGGSAWWRAVNRDLLVAGERRACCTRRARSGWHGYLEHEALARDELPLEQHLLTVVLIRVLFAHAMVDPPPRRGGHLEDGIERLVADPGLPAVDVPTDRGRCDRGTRPAGDPGRPARSALRS
jgi:hypothetical protein